MNTRPSLVKLLLAVALFLASPALADGVADAWLTRAPMHESRMNPARTLLPGNRVLVVGGFDDNFGAGNTAEIYDRATDTWTYVAPVPQAHAGAGAYAVPLPGGAVLYAGGVYFDHGFGSSNLVIQNGAWLFHPRRGDWTPLPSIPGVGSGDINSNAVVTAGTVVIAGGSSDDSASTDFSATASRRTFVFDIASHTWSRGGDMIDPRAHEHFTLLDDGRILVAGGRIEFFRKDGNDVYSRRVEAYDPATRTWSQIGTLPPTEEDAASLVPGARWGHIQHRLRDGRVLIAGGAYTTEGDAYNLRKSAFIFDPRPNVAEPWQRVEDLPEPAYMQIAADLPGRRDVLVAAGEIGPFGSIDWPTSWIFDPDSGSWDEAAPMPSVPAPACFGLPAGTRILPSATYNLQTGFTRFPDGALLLSGGFNNELDSNCNGPTFSRRTYLYDPGAPGRR